MNKISKIKTLIKSVDKYNEMYYNEGTSTITDYEYDKLFAELLELEKETGIIFSNSPTQKVGYKVSNKLNKIKHTHKMLSLGKCRNTSEVLDFLKSNQAIAMVKMDGLTISAEYEDGKLIRLETRGDGEIGNDVLFHAASIENLPKQIKHPGSYIIDGEVVITYSDFEEINNELSKENRYRNPRNLAAGSLNLLESKESAKRHLQFIAWDVIKGGKSNNFIDNLREAEKYGFTIVLHDVLEPTITNDELLVSFNNLKEKAKSVGYPSDGIVIKFNDISYGKTLGCTGHHFNNAIAYKFEDELYETKIKDVEWSIGKTGTLCPVAVFEPIDIDGTIVERASMHNLNIYNELCVLPGDTVLIYKANQIIPQIDKNLSLEEREAKGIITYLSHPSTCPICGHTTKIEKTNEAQILVCGNSSCKGKLLGKLNNFVSKQGMDINGLSDATLKKFIEKGWIDKISDIYELHTHKKEIQSLNGFGARSTENLLKAIENSKEVEMDKFLCALGIKGIGKAQARVIAKKFDYDWFKFEEAIANNYNFSNLDGIGEVLNQNIYSWYADNFIQDGINNLSYSMKFIYTKSRVNSDSKLQGKVFVITGAVHSFSNRNELKDRLESLGATVSSSISSKTSFLINNDVNSSSSKNKKAKELGIPILSEEDFLKMIGRM